MSLVIAPPARFWTCGAETSDTQIALLIARHRDVRRRLGIALPGLHLFVDRESYAAEGSELKKAAIRAAKRSEGATRLSPESRGS